MSSIYTREVRSKFLLLGLLQVSKWIGYGFSGVALAAILRKEGADLTQISMLMGVGFLFMFKFLWAPLVDRFRIAGLPTYKGWYLLAQALMAASLVPLLWQGPKSDVDAILILLVISSVAATFRDIAMDGLSVKLLKQEERASANGVMSAGFMLGMVLGGGVLLMLYDQIGWSGSIWFLVLGTVAPLPFVALYAEPHVAQARGVDSPPFWHAFAAFFKVKGNLQWAGLIILMSTAGITGPSLLALMLVDNGWPLVKVGAIANTAGPLLAAVLSLAAGVVFARLSRRTALVSIMVLGAVFSFAKMPIASNAYPEAITIALAILAVVTGAWTNIAQKIVVTDKATSTTDFGTNFTLQGSLNQVGSNLATVAAPLLAKELGYANVLLIGGLIGLLTSFLLYRYRHL